MTTLPINMDPVEAGIIGPILRCEGVEDAVSRLEALGFTAVHLPSRACRAVWNQYRALSEQGGFTVERLMSWGNRADELGETQEERSVWMAQVQPMGLAATMHLNGAELIERALLEEAKEGVDLAARNSVSSSEMCDSVENKIAIIRAKAANGSENEKEAAIGELVEEIEAAERGEPLPLSHVPTWDQALSGLHKAQLIVLAGRPGGGKTSLAEEMIDAKVQRGEDVLYIQRELSRTRAVGRLACRRAQVPWSAFENRTASAEQLSRVKRAVLEYLKWPLHLMTVGGCGATTIASAIRHHVREHDARLVVLDYLQLLPVPRGMERRNVIADMCIALKQAANSSGCTIIAIAQLGRAKDDTRGKPTFADLKESGDIEQAADVILALWSSEDREDRMQYPVNWSILKNRNGGLGTRSMMFDGPSMTFLGETSERGDES